MRLQTVSETYLSRCDEARRRVADLHRAPPGAHLDRRSRLAPRPVDPHLLDHQRGRRSTFQALGRVDDHRTPHRGEPEPTVAGPPTRRLGPAVGFGAGHAVGLVEPAGRQGLDLPTGQASEVLQPHPENSPVATHPETAVVVLEDLEDQVAEKTVPHAVAHQGLRVDGLPRPAGRRPTPAPGREVEQSVTGGSDPQPAPPVPVEREDEDAFETGPGANLPVGQVAQTAFRSHPQTPGGIRQQRPDSGGG